MQRNTWSANQLFDDLRHSINTIAGSSGEAWRHWRHSAAHLSGQWQQIYWLFKNAGRQLSSSLHKEVIKMIPWLHLFSPEAVTVPPANLSSVRNKQGIHDRSWYRLCLLTSQTANSVFLPLTLINKMGSLKTISEIFAYGYNDKLSVLTEAQNTGTWSIWPMAIEDKLAGRTN